MKQRLFEIVLGSMLVTVCLGLGSCQKIKNAISKFKDGKQETEFSSTYMRQEGRSTYQQAEAKLTLEMDYPQGDSKAAIMLRRWFYEKVMEEPCTEDIKDGKVLFDKLLAKYKQQNSPELMKDVLEDETEGTWYCDIRFKKEWDGDNIVSYTYSVSAFNVGNATSSAWICDICVNKADGRTLGWEMFKSKTDVKNAIDELLVTKYGHDGADLYETGIPMPEAPLFLGNGIRFDYGDYSIVTPHVFEETGEFPCCLLSYDSYKYLLTDEACRLLKLEGDVTETDAVDDEASLPNSQNQDKESFALLIKAWDELHALDTYDRESLLYANTVKFYGMTVSGYEAKERLLKLLQKSPDFHQTSTNIRVTRESNRLVRCKFDKQTSSNGQSKVYPSYLVFELGDDGSWRIVEESDEITDRNLSKRKNK